MSIRYRTPPIGRQERVPLSWGSERQRRSRAGWPKWLQLSALGLLLLMPERIAMALMVLLLVAKVGITVVSWGARARVQRIAARPSSAQTAVRICSMRSWLSPPDMAHTWVSTGPAGGGMRRSSGRCWCSARRGRARPAAVIIPALLSHNGPVVSTSTKPDVLAATARRSRAAGRVWEFDPTGTGHRPRASAAAVVAGTCSGSGTGRC